MESTILASPAVKIQSFIFEIPNATEDQVIDVFSIIIDNSVLWADRGWGGIISGTTAIYINPALDSSSAQQDLTPLIDYAFRVQSSGGSAVSVFHEYSNWKAFYDVFAASFFVVSIGQCDTVVAIDIILGRWIKSRAKLSTDPSW